MEAAAAVDGRHINNAERRLQQIGSTNMPPIDRFGRTIGLLHLETRYDRLGIAWHVGENRKSRLSAKSI